MPQRRARRAYRVKAESIEACNCQHGCNCQFAGFPNEGSAIHHRLCVKDGRVGDVSLNGLAPSSRRSSKAIHEGNGQSCCSSTRKPGRSGERTRSVLSGELGGMPGSARGYDRQVRSPIRKPIEIRWQARSPSCASPVRSTSNLTPFVDVQVGAGEGSPHHVSEGRLLLERRQNRYDVDDARAARRSLVEWREVRGGGGIN